MNLNGHIIIVADLGEFKAYRVNVVSGSDPHETMQVAHVNKTGGEKTAVNLELLRDVDYIASHTRTSEAMSDQQGQFGADSGEARSTGEAHNSALEEERRGLEKVAQDISAVLAETGAPVWHLAFPKAHNAELLEMLGAEAKNSLKKCVAADLTKVAKGELLSHFE